MKRKLDRDELHNAMSYFMDELLESYHIVAILRRKDDTMRVGFVEHADMRVIKKVWLETAEKFPTVKAQILYEFEIYFGGEDL